MGRLMRASSGDDNWYYAQNGERKGPVSLVRLKAMAAEGWLKPEDLIWRAGLAEWIPAQDADEIFPGSLGKLLRKTIAGLQPTKSSAVAELSEDSSPPTIPAKISKPAKAKRQSRAVSPAKPESEVDWSDLSPRHLVAAGGGFLAALGIAFTAIAQSNVALAFTLSGLFIAGAGLYVEIGRLLGQAIENIGKASREAAERRLRAKELALEKQRLDLEAARLTQENASRDAAAAPATVLANHQAEYAPASPASPGQVVVINQPPVRLWSPGLAAVLSFFMPGLGQLYKGQFFNAVAWFFIVMLGYAALIVPGLILHFFCVLGALSGNPWTEGKTTVVRQ